MENESSEDWTFDRTFLNLYQGFPGAFGDPDGRRADLVDFVNVSELQHSTLFNPSSQRIRIVVGSKGSGKTFYLKRMKADLESVRSSIRVVGEEQRLPIVDETEATQLFSTLHVLKVAHWFSGNVLTEVWQQLWGRAIILSVVSHLLNNRTLRTHVEEDERKRLRSDFGTLIRSLRRDTRSPFTTARDLIDRAHSGDEFIRGLDDPLWDDLEGRVAMLLQRTPPLYIFIDTVDEEFTSAPVYWLRCQKGLFYETMRLLRHAKIGSRLHVVISVRDIVLYSIFRSEHGARYVGDPHVRVLAWNFDSARELLDAKIRRLRREFWQYEEQPTDLSTWTGLHSVTSKVGRREDLYTYALRHTQKLPRDVVLFGNLLGRSVVEVRNANRAFTEEDFREVVSNIARISGLQHIEIVANQIRADEVPAEATYYNFTESFLSIEEYADTRATQIIGILHACKSLRINHTTYLELQQRGRSDLQAPDLASALWQAGLLGYQDRSTGADVFFAIDKLGRFTVPRDADEYVFHPSMREVAGLKPISTIWQAPAPLS